MLKTIGYIKIVSPNQNTEKNKASILGFAKNNHVRSANSIIFVEEAVESGSSWKERKIANVLDDLKEGDNLIISELAQLGGSMLEIMKIKSVIKEKGINLHIIKGNQ